MESWLIFAIVKTLKGENKLWLKTFREMVNEFEKQRQMLMSVSMQKQQMQANINGLEVSLKELENTKETKVYKAAGAISFRATLKK